MQLRSHLAWGQLMPFAGCKLGTALKARSKQVADVVAVGESAALEWRTQRWMMMMMMMKVLDRLLWL